MKSINIQAVNTPQFPLQLWDSYKIPSNFALIEEGNAWILGLTAKQILPYDFHIVTKLQNNINAYEKRVNVLRYEGELDRIMLNGPSEVDFYLFVKSVPYTRRASIVLLDNGNLRAVWGDEDGSHFGIQFRGERSVSYVIFKRRSSTSDVSRVSGKDTIDGVRQQIRAFGLETLLNA